MIGPLLGNLEEEASRPSCSSSESSFPPLHPVCAATGHVCPVQCLLCCVGNWCSGSLHPAVRKSFLLISLHTYGWLFLFTLMFQFVWAACSLYSCLPCLSLWLRSQAFLQLIYYFSRRSKSTAPHFVIFVNGVPWVWVVDSLGSHMYPRKWWNSMLFFPVFFFLFHFWDWV